MSNGWVGVDFDGTLSHYEGWQGVEHSGAPIMPMVNRVKQWLAEGKDVRIFTARVDNGNFAIKIVELWCMKHIGKILPVTNVKDKECICIYDDRAVQVEKNTGKLLGVEFL